MTKNTFWIELSNNIAILLQMRTSIVQYIADKRSAGLSDSQIIHELLDAGWHMDIIQKTLHAEPLRHRNLEPILDIKKQPLRKISLSISVIVILGILLLLAIYR